MSSLFWITMGGAIASCLVVLFLIGRRNERLIRRDWEMLLTPRGEKVYGAIEGKVRTEIGMADLSFEHALVYRELGTTEEAIRLLDVGYRVIEKFAPDMLRLLAAMATFSRMVSAIAPVQPLRPKNFRLVQVASLAYLHGMLHQFVVSASERYRLKLYILGRSFGLATRFLLKSIQTLGEGAAAKEADREWEQIDAIRADFQTLTDESLDSLRILLTAMAREDRQDLLRQIAPR
jgi:hypothetical protein